MHLAGLTVHVSFAQLASRKGQLPLPPKGSLTPPPEPRSPRRSPPSGGRRPWVVRSPTCRSLIVADVPFSFLSACARSISVPAKVQAASATRQPPCNVLDHRVQLAPLWTPDCALPDR